MRKKLFAALAVQLAAVVFILGFSCMTSMLSEKYGKVCSGPCYASDMSISPETDSDSPGSYRFNFYNYQCENTDGFERYTSYKDDSESDNYFYLYIDSHTTEDCVPSISFNGGYVIDDRETGSTLYYLSCYHDDSFRNLFDAKELTANIKVYRDRVKLISVTVNGVEFGEYFSDPAHFDFE